MAMLLSLTKKLSSTYFCLDVCLILGKAKLVILFFLSYFRYRSERSSSNSKEHLKELLSHLRDVKLRYKIAVEFNFNDVINNILEKADGAYIKDSIYSY